VQRWAVLDRDGHQCTWVEDGVRCTATEKLQVHHLDPARNGGATMMDRLVTLCHKHHVQAERLIREAERDG
jgi:5-methylcytosine-specific restriction endonuclease McrA